MKNVFLAAVLMGGMLAACNQNENKQTTNEDMNTTRRSRLRTATVSNSLPTCTFLKVRCKR